VGQIVATLYLVTEAGAVLASSSSPVSIVAALALARSLGMQAAIVTGAPL
jgi:hypothetical protein